MIMQINIFSENIYNSIELDEKKYIDIAREILKYYISKPDIYELSCLNNQDYDILSFDILYCDNVKTHKINKEYRGKDYPADIITFAIFADTDENSRFIFDGEINLGEIIISLDGVREEAQKAGKTNEQELIFLISHGILHLLGFDHQTMNDYEFVVNLQNEAIKSLKLGKN